MKETHLNIKMMFRSFFFLILVSVMIFNMTIYHVYGQTGELRATDPKTGSSSFRFYSNTTLVGTRFNVTVDVRDAADLYSFQLCLKYNSSMLDAKRAWIREEDTEYVFYGRNAIAVGPYFYYNDPLYDTSVLMGGTLLGSVSGFDGAGLIAIVEFEIVKKPNVGETLSCNLNINNEKTFLGDSVGKKIQPTKTDGYYRYTWAAPLTYLIAEPRVYKTSELESFNITVWLNNTITEHGLVYVKFGVSYSSTILNVTQVVEGNFLAGFGDTVFNYTIEPGRVTIENSLVNYTSFPEGNGEIAIITFHGEYQDIVTRYSSIKFVDAQFLDDNGDEVAVVLMDGTYEIAETTDLGITINLHADNWIKSDSKYIIIQGEEVVINGSVTPTKEGVNVTIYCLGGGIEQWRKHIETDSNGRYEYLWKTSQKDPLGGLLEFQANWEDGLDVIAESDVWSYLEIQIMGKSEITITANPKTVVAGRNTTIKGTITQFEITPHAPVNVTIYYKFANETDGWTELATVKTNTKGSYSHQWTVQEIGKYKLKASWPGDLPLMEGDESDELTLEVVETLPFDIMAYLPYILGAIIVVAIVILYFKKFR